MGGRRSEIIPVHREIVRLGEILFTDFTGTVVLHSCWRLTYKTPGKLADSSFTTPKIERKIWSSERILSSEKLSAFYMNRLRKSCHHMLPCENYIMALILVFVVQVSNAFISIIFTFASQKIYGILFNWEWGDAHLLFKSSFEIFMPVCWKLKHLTCLRV